jgi:predicted small lipoprotein YifL
MRFLIVCVGLALGLAGCGLRGPLYLRDNPPPGIKPAKPPPVKPVPYPETGNDEKN